MRRTDGAAVHVLSVDDGATVAVPATGYAIGVRRGSVRHRVASSQPGEIPRSMASLTLVVFEGGHQVHEEMVVDGDTAFFRDLELKLLDVVDARARFEVLRSPFPSTVPRPARR